MVIVVQLLVITSYHLLHVPLELFFLNTIYCYPGKNLTCSFKYATLCWQTQKPKVCVYVSVGAHMCL